MKVELIDSMGCDLSVVNAARVSFDKESEWEWDYSKFGELDYAPAVLAEKDVRLIAFLAKHNHWSPFSHTSLSFRIKAPIFVARQLGKHQVGLSWNEVSRRYVDAEPEFYTPEVWRKRAADKKQGSSDEAIDKMGFHWLDGTYSEEPVGSIYDMAVSQCEGVYNAMLRAGVCPEQARMVLPQSMMTEWIWTGSLYAFARVCNLRLEPDTQAETRVIAQGIAQEAEKLFPVSWEALVA